MDVILVINTCSNYFKNTIPELIKQINTSNFPKENVLIVSGQENEECVSYEEGIKIVKVTYTGMHLTGLIYIYENIELFKNINYFIEVPDTVKFGPTFFDKIMNFYNINLKDKEINAVPFINFSIIPSMDMGILHINHIKNIGCYLKKIKLDYPYNKEQLINLKRQLVYDENMIFSMRGHDFYRHTRVESTYTYDPTLFIANSKDDFDSKNVNDKILQTYIKPLDYYKYQRNFNGPYVELIIDY